MERNIGIVGMKSMAAAGLFGGSSFFQAEDLPRSDVRGRGHQFFIVAIDQRARHWTEQSRAAAGEGRHRAFVSADVGRRARLSECVADLTAAGGVEFYNDEELGHTGVNREYPAE